MRVSAVLFALALLASPAPPRALSAQDTGEKTEKRDRNLITRAELLRSGQSSKDLYQAILSLRPHFLAPLALRSTEPRRSPPPKPVVYIDGNLSGDPDVLRGILVEHVEAVRFKGPTEAGLEYGSDAIGGAILVKLYSRPKP